MRVGGGGNSGFTGAAPSIAVAEIAKKVLTFSIFEQKIADKKKTKEKQIMKILQIKF